MVGVGEYYLNIKFEKKITKGDGEINKQILSININYLKISLEINKIKYFNNYYFIIFYN